LIRCSLLGSVKSAAYSQIPALLLSRQQPASEGRITKS
jgi:hypothetical protein